MAEMTRPIFRPEALRRYMEGREKAVLPRFIAPPTFILLWLMLALLACGFGAAWLARVPVYASGIAVVAPPRHIPAHIPARGGRGETIALVFLAPDSSERPRIGESVSLSGAAADLFDGTIVAVERGVYSPAAAQKRFKLDSGAAAAVTGPVVAALARFRLPRGALPADDYTGSVYRADVRTGTQRVLALIPIIGPLVGGRR